MSIHWGSWQYASGNGMRVGLAVSIPLAPTHSSPSVTFQVKVYTQNQYSYSSDAQTLNYSDDLSGTFGFTNGEGSYAVLRETKEYVYTYSTYGPSPGYAHFTAQISDADNGVTPSVTTSYQIPGRPVYGPDAPTDALLTRNSDSQATLTWTIHPTSEQPYDYQIVSMRRWDGSTVWTEETWNYVAYVSGSAESYIKYGLSSNHAYQMAPRAENSYGSSDWDDSNVIFMTPAAPSDVSSEMNTTGTAITTTWTDNAYNYYDMGSWKIQRSVAGGAFTDLDTVSDRTQTTYIDNSPGSGTNQYRVACIVDSLQSSYATGNEVSAPAPPYAPTLLDPDGSYVDFVNDDVDLTWQHNPGGTGTAQTHFTIEYSDDAGSNWYPLATDVASSTSSYTITAGTLTNGTPYLWKVKTEGLVSAGYGSFSASASVEGSTKPTATLTLPETTTYTIPLTVSWIYGQGELLAQIAYQVLLYDETGTILLEEINGFDATVQVSFAYATVTETDYVVKARVQSSAGVWSNYASVTTTFILLPPATAQVTGIFQPCSGTVLLHLEPGEVIEGTNVADESVTVERRVAGGDWVALATGLLIPTDFLDTLPLTRGSNEYRVTALSATPSTVVSPILEVSGDDGDDVGDPLWVWVSYGDNFEYDLRLHGDLDVSETSGRVKAQQHFLGRAQPVALVGRNTNRSLSVSGKLRYDSKCEITDPDSCTYDSTPTEWRSAGTDSEVVCYRDYTGRRVFGTLSDVAVAEDLWPGKAAVSFSVVEVGFTERYVVL